MKTIYGTIAIAVLATMAAGCGSSNNSSSTPAGAVTSGAVAAPGTATIPVGCYTPGTSIQYGNANTGSCPAGAVACPQGYTQNGTSCILTSGSVSNGVNCQPMNGTYSPSYYGCVTTTPCTSYSGYTCQQGYPYSNGSIYYYTNGAPSYNTYNPYSYGYYNNYGYNQGYWVWNGYSWVWI